MRIRPTVVVLAAIFVGWSCVYLMQPVSAKVRVVKERPAVKHPVRCERNKFGQCKPVRR